MSEREQRLSFRTLAHNEKATLDVPQDTGKATCLFLVVFFRKDHACVQSYTLVFSARNQGASLGTRLDDIGRFSIRQ